MTRPPSSARWRTRSLRIVGAARPVDHRAVVEAATRSRRRAPWVGSGALNLGVAAVVIVLFAGFVLTGSPTERRDDTPAPGAVASALPTPRPEPTTSRPSPDDGLLWSHEQASRDWPLPIRSEPGDLGGQVVLVVPRKGGKAPTSFADERGDVPPEARDVDIVNVATSWNCWSPPSACVRFDIAKMPAKDTDATTRWIAYGIVTDDDGDGRADRRLGIDNDASTETGHRMWRTDLATGTTVAYRTTLEDPRNMDASFPRYGGRDLRRRWGRGSGHGDLFVHAPSDAFRFYVWASVVEDGVVVGTDFAPDIGWIALWSEEAADALSPTPPR